MVVLVVRSRRFCCYRNVVLRAMFSSGGIVGMFRKEVCRMLDFIGSLGREDYIVRGV